MVDGRPGRIEVEDAVRGSPGASTWMRRTSRALAEALFTTDDGPPPRERLDFLVDDLDHFLRHAGGRARLIFRGCLAAVDTTAPVLAGCAPPFHRLSLSDRTRALVRLEETPLGLALLGAKAILCMIYYEHPDAAAFIGNDGSCLKDSEP